LRDAAAERPVLLGDLDEVDEDVLAPDLQLVMQIVGDALEKAFFMSTMRPAFMVI
jgi:hypothetical protein